MKSRKPILLFAAPGGHLTELLELGDAFRDREIHYFTYAEKPAEGLVNAHYFPNLARKPWRLFDVSFRLFRLFIRLKPACLVSTGGELAIPAFILAKLFFRVKLVFIECSAQVKRPSLTGKILYPFCDVLFVQWPALLPRYGKKAQYAGGLI